VTRFVLLLAAAAALLAVAASPAAALRYNGTVGPDRTITLKRNGTLVRSVSAGTHTFVIRDRSGVHNFVLARGDTRLRGTTLSFQGETTWSVRIRTGATYKYYCSAHRATMTRTFRVS
jgi:plastocyanin